MGCQGWAWGCGCVCGGDSRDCDVGLNKGHLLLTLQVVATLGTTSCCSFDNLLEVGPICKYLIKFYLEKIFLISKDFSELPLWALLYNINLIL